MTGDRSPSIILALDSANSACSALIAAGDKVLGIEHIAGLHGQAEALLPLIDTAMGKAGLPPAAIEIVATTIGPGSFTGIRVGLAAARGIALATGASLIGVTSFEAVAAVSGRPGRKSSPYLLVTLESRRQDFFVQLFDRLRNPIGEPAAVAPAALGDMVSSAVGAAPLLIAGDAALRVAALLAEQCDASVLSDPVPVAVGALRAALHCLRLGEPGRAARPLYLRAPDVTLPSSRPIAPRGPV